jgi:mono/diheme cytochrome c family protein
MLESKYLKGMPATFIDPPSDRKVGFSDKGNPDVGKMIYESSCLHCHEDKRYSFFNLDNADLTFEFMNKHITQYTRYSIYQVARYGTSPIPGKKAYMPHYTKEKMSEQMLKDLRVYIEQRAK